ncbi:colicin-like bacteriocin tRNase domain-containing protein [Xenorhabdus griffiniae]|uniref:colicin-like bacteriocin tRNase domain-containing protein n=1 Tax=Xenorhabdus griffiniae TaxID=351672 RepID=UPI002359E5F8|nr:colicin-like bacteriocin tRNase domain-containing protein [Xenorhabdus griffiniae]MDC9606927.1 colicin-like bacteriocin tRNase domain-containing protein [Xenorhabdus griffiniae]
MHDSITVTGTGPSRDAGWGNENGFGDYNGGGSSGSGGSSRLAGYAVAALSMARPGMPALVFPVNGVLSATLNLNIGTLNTGFMNLGSYIDNANPFATRLAGSALGMAKFGSRFAGPVVGVSSLLLDLESKRQDAAAKIEREAIENARREAQRHGITDVYQVTALPVATLFAGALAMDKINAKIRGQSTVITDVVAQPVVDTKTQLRQIAITRNPTSVPVVKAKETRNDVYSIQVVSGMKPMQIHIDTFRGWSSENKVNTAATVGIFSPISVDHHHAILDFDGEHDPIYISVSKVPTVSEEKVQLEAAKKREQEWLLAHPLLAAELEFSEAVQEFESIDKPYQEKQKQLNQLLSSPEGLTLSDPVKYPLVYQQTQEQLKFTKTEIKVNDQNLINTLLQKGVNDYRIEALKPEFEKKPIGPEIIVKSAFYERLGRSLHRVHKEIEQTKKELAPLMENRNKAESKKKEKEQKVAKEKKKKSARDKPGIATGNGKEVGSDWLEGVSKRLGIPIPKSVADKLRGKKFSSFDKLREAIWSEIGKTPKLAGQIKRKANKNAIAKGRAPFARKNGQVGGRKKLELHHVDEIQHGGDVYNFDNIRVVTPKNHIHIHSKK